MRSKWGKTLVLCMLAIWVFFLVFLFTTHHFNHTAHKQENVIIREKFHGFDSQRVLETQFGKKENASVPETSFNGLSKPAAENASWVSGFEEHDMNSVPSNRSEFLKTCATVEEMGNSAAVHIVEDASIRLKKMVDRHFDLYGAATVRELPPENFCKQNFVFGRSSEAGFGNEMYRILTAGALSLLLNRSLIIGEKRDNLPFGDYLEYTEEAFSLKEIRFLWAKNQCTSKYKRPLVMRIDDFLSPTRTAVLCEDWRLWKYPVVWLKSTTDSVGMQFFLKNIHPEMRNAAYALFGDPLSPSSRPNLIGILLKFIISPKVTVDEAVKWALKDGPDPDITLHMRMRTKRSNSAINAAVRCVKKSLREFSQKVAKPRLVLVTDTPSIKKQIAEGLKNEAEVIHFDYVSYTTGKDNDHVNTTNFQSLTVRASDWGPMPRWVAFVDFFLASRAKHAVVSGAHRRVGTTYAQLIAARAAANKIDEVMANDSNFYFYSSFQGGILNGGLSNQIGWGHVWNRFGGKLSCRDQSEQCAITPLLPYGWWDGKWQSPIARDIRRLKNYGVVIDDEGNVLENSLKSYCKSRKVPINTMTLQIPSCKKCANQR